MPTDQTIGFLAWHLKMMSLMLLSMAMTPIKPIAYAFLILSASIVTALSLFKMLLTSWLSFVLIMVFSSGMMTLFVYLSSLAPNEKKSSRFIKLTLFLSLINFTPNSTMKSSKQQMSSFSQQALILLMTSVLILTMLSVSFLSFNPQQSMASTF